MFFSDCGYDDDWRWDTIDGDYNRVGIQEPRMIRHMGPRASHHLMPESFGESCLAP